ncbi:Trafficking protein particle complex subunit 12 [Orchesella cincta]|uniref:Trafficking protein particle complex subunit 12 n=1 Tax=Orchesella cincta TaxID=48709 RepID=A0A1D2NIX9_ORCCI|nr:Trafficking protein particle complex subunit 12 [Orchesella cincta]
MEGSSGKADDEEPQICTVFSSTPSSQSKTIFDTIAFSVPKKESSVMSPTSPFSEDVPSKATYPFGSQPNTENTGNSETVVSSTSLFSQTQALPQSSFGIPVESSAVQPPPAMFESLSMSYMATGPASCELEENLPLQMQDVISGLESSSLSSSADPLTGTVADDSLKGFTQEVESLSLHSQNVATNDTSVPVTETELEDSPLPTANSLFADAPEVPFPIGNYNATNVTLHQHSVGPVPEAGGNSLQSVFDGGMAENLAIPTDAFSSISYSTMDLSYDAWIPIDSTRKVLMSVATAVHAGTYFPEKTHMTTPGIIYKEDLVDKVAVNMSRIFGEVEANKRQILTADNVTQDDNGVRELIKLGCYRSAINLTKRLLTLYGQGPGKIGHFSKHTPHSLQLWMTRLALLVRIREFKIAESELEAFNNFENPDMYYEYYQDAYGQGRRGSMVPFYFRLLAAEIPQYASKSHNESMDRLRKLHLTVQQIITNINEGISEDGSPITLDRERKDSSLDIWKKREIRILYSLTNAFLLAKDFSNALKHLSALREKDTERNAQLTSAIGRLFLQFGDLTTAQTYFKEAAGIRSSNSELDRVENLVDAALYYIAQGVYTDAFGLLKEALVIQPDNFMITNNMAVCLLYMGRVKESLALMETTVRNNTPQLLQENVILNLSTIYELENSDGFKKNSLLKLISEYKGDGINLASLKMPNLI